MTTSSGKKALTALKAHSAQMFDNGLPNAMNGHRIYNKLAVHGIVGLVHYAIPSGTVEPKVDEDRSGVSVP